MSNEITLFNTASDVDLSYLNNVVDPLTQQLAGSLFGKRISIKAGVFRMIVAGQEVAATTDRHLNIVVVDAAPKISRHYYKDQYQEGVTTTPTCWSNDGVKPEEACATKQSDTCMACPMNIKGSGTNDSRACRYSQRLAVVLANDIKGDVFALSLPAQSLFGDGTDKKMPLQRYTRMLASHNLPIRAVVTRMTFDLDSSAPKLVFSADRPLNQNEYETVLRQAQTDDAKAAIAPPNYSTGAVTDIPFMPEPIFNQDVEAVSKEAEGIITQAQSSVKAKPVKKATKPAAPEPEVIEEPVVKAAVKATVKPPADIEKILSDWDDD
jgi:hypothetical protein